MSCTTTSEENTPMTTTATDITAAAGGNPLVEQLTQQAAALDTLLRLATAHNLRSGHVTVGASHTSSIVAVNTAAEFLAWATALDVTEFTTWRDTTGQIVLITDSQQIDTTTAVRVIAHIDDLPGVDTTHATKPLTDLTAAVVAGTGVR